MHSKGPSAGALKLVAGWHPGPAKQSGVLKSSKSVQFKGKIRRVIDSQGVQTDGELGSETPPYLSV